jgi:hypothetical protein
MAQENSSASHSAFSAPGGSGTSGIHSGFSVVTFHMSESYATDFGDYDRDLSGSIYNLAWDSLRDMEKWLKGEQEEKCIELRKKEVVCNKAKGTRRWLAKHIYVCARQGTGSKSKYVKKNPDWNRKVPSKRLETGCQCRLVVRTYPNTEKVLGKYTSEHDHAIGMENLRFTQLPNDVRMRIADLLRMGVSRENIVRMSYNE